MNVTGLPSTWVRILGLKSFKGYWVKSCKLLEQNGLQTTVLLLLAEVTGLKKTIL